jgi:hypothetical protein
MTKHLTQEEYSDLKDLWRDSYSLISYEFPVLALCKHEIKWNDSIHPFVAERLRELGYDPPRTDYKKWFWDQSKDLNNIAVALRKANTELWEIHAREREAKEKKEHIRATVREFALGLGLAAFILVLFALACWSTAWMWQ